MTIEDIKSQLEDEGYDHAIAIATQSEIEAGAACGQLSIITDDENMIKPPWKSMDKAPKDGRNVFLAYKWYNRVSTNLAYYSEIFYEDESLNEKGWETPCHFIPEEDCLGWVELPVWEK